jgi:hypothetical protein
MRKNPMSTAAKTTWRAKRALRFVALHRLMGAVRPGMRASQT